MRYDPDRQMVRIRQQAAEARRAGGAVEQAELQPAADLLDVADPPPLRPEALARIRRGVAARLAPAPKPHPRGRSLRWKESAPRRRSWLTAAAAIGAVLASAVGVSAALWRYQRREALGTAAQANAPAPAAAAKRRPPHHRRAVAANGAGEKHVEEGEGLPAAIEGVPRPEGAMAPAGEPMPAPRSEVTPPPAPPVAPRRGGRALGTPPPAGTPSEAAAGPRNETEARMLARALAQLRQQHDPRAAIATLDRLARTYPGGVLAAEAQATRIEAALAMNDLATATKLVETAAPSPGGAGAALLVARAELRARAGRCDAATRDFARVLETTPAGAGDLRERALYGRGVCLGRLGQADGARRDLVAYLREHPNGRFSDEARRLLDQTPGTP